MKKDSNKLAFNKEKVANLSSADLDLVVGGQEAPIEGGDPSSHKKFTCYLCTTLTGIAAGGGEEQA